MPNDQLLALSNMTLSLIMIAFGAAQIVFNKRWMKSIDDTHESITDLFNEMLTDLNKREEEMKTIIGVYDIHLEKKKEKKPRAKAA